MGHTERDRGGCALELQGGLTNRQNLSNVPVKRRV
jgi:hypothetical protein